MSLRKWGAHIPGQKDRCPSALLRRDVKGYAVDENLTLVVFAIDEQRYALPLSSVERVVRAVEVTALPRAPATLLGAINLQGRVLPVLNLRRRFQLPQRELDLNDEFLIVRTAARTVALWVDLVCEVRACSPQTVIAAEQVAPRLDELTAVVKLENGLLLVQDLERLLVWDETGDEDRPAVSREATP